MFWSISAVIMLKVIIFMVDLRKPYTVMQQIQSFLFKTLFYGQGTKFSQFWTVYHNDGLLQFTLLLSSYSIVLFPSYSIVIIHETDLLKHLYNTQQ